MQFSSTIENQYRLATQAAGLCSRSDRGLLEATGNDRGVWLNNLVTNVVKTLHPGDGNYAFAPNNKGRVVFDLNVLVLTDRLWLDLDRRWLDTARRHLSRYIITEDVVLADRTAAFDRLAVVGPAAADVIGRLGFGNLTPMAQLQHVGITWDGHEGRLIRHDFAGLAGAEILVSPAAAGSLQSALLDAGRPAGLARIDSETVETLRIESGIPASFSDIDEDVIPPETLQVERGISYHKGCYLGQEVIERLRSHGVLARRLVGVRLSAVPPPGPPMKLNVGDAEGGRLTSLCWSYAIQSPLGLGYLKTAHVRPGQPVTAVAGASEIAGEVVSLPVRPRAAGAP